MTKPSITQADIKRQVSYNPRTGSMIWKEDANARQKAGWSVISLNKMGVRYVSINKKNYSPATIAWIYYYGNVSIGKKIIYLDADLGNLKISNLARIYPVVKEKKKEEVPISDKLEYCMSPITKFDFQQWLQGALVGANIILWREEKLKELFIPIRNYIIQHYSQVVTIHETDEQWICERI